VSKVLAARAAGAPRTLVALLTLALFINYVDRGNLATSAPMIKDQLHLDEEQIGYLISAFYWTYVVAMIPVGWATERFGAHRVLAIGATLWSVATLFTGFAGGITMLLGMRLLLGLAESAIFPASSALLATYVPREGLGKANGTISFGYLVGPAIGTFIGGMLMARYGWRAVFIGFGAASFLWLIPWLRFSARTAPVEASAPTEVPAVSPTYRQILRQPGLWGASLGHFAGNFTWYFILSFMPLYLVDVRHLSTESMAGVLGAAYFINAVCAVIAGWYADRWIRRGGSPTLIYKLLMNVCAVVSVAAMLGMVLLPAAYSIPCLVVYEIFLGFSSPGTFGIGQIMAGPTATGRWIGVQNFCGNLAGIIAPALTGWLVHTTGNYNIAFTIAGLVSLIGLFGYLVVLPKVEPIDWSKA
jgi:MFS family permease